MTGYLLKLDNCCGVISLRVGTLIALWLFVASYTLGTVPLVFKHISNVGIDPLASSYIVSMLIVTVIILLGFYAVHKKKPGYLWAFFFLWALNVVVFPIVAIFQIIINIGKFNISEIGQWFFGGIFVTVAGWFFMSVILSHISELQTKRENLPA